MVESAEPDLVFVSVGTDHHAFPRLLSMVKAWGDTHPDVEIVVQRGHTPAIDGLDCRAFLDVEQLSGLLARATAVVCHGGPSTIMEARAAGHVPVVVARDPERGEHVDGHQLRFVDRVGEDGIVIAAQTLETLDEALESRRRVGRADPTALDRPEATAAIEAIGARLDALIDQRHARPNRRRNHV